jgi:hypothetical protein
MINWGSLAAKAGHTGQTRVQIPTLALFFFFQKQFMLGFSIFKKKTYLSEK